MIKITLCKNITYHSTLNIINIIKRFTHNSTITVTKDNKPINATPVNDIETNQPIVKETTFITETVFSSEGKSSPTPSSIDTWLESFKNNKDNWEKSKNMDTNAISQQPVINMPEIPLTPINTQPIYNEPLIPISEPTFSQEEAETFRDDAVETMTKIKVASATIGETLQTTLQKQNVIIKESQAATERQETIYRRTEEFIRSFGTYPRVRNAAYMIAAAATIYGVLRFLNVPLGGFIGGIGGGIFGNQNGARTPSSNVNVEAPVSTHNINVQPHYHFGSEFSPKPSVTADSLISSTTSFWLNLAIGVGILYLSYKSKKLPIVK